MMQSYLKAAEIFVPRHRIRESLNAINPIGTASRWSRAIKRRTYKVTTPNSLWHMDAHLKLSRYNFIFVIYINKNYFLFLIFFIQLIYRLFTQFYRNNYL